MTEKNSEDVYHQLRDIYVGRQKDLLEQKGLIASHRTAWTGERGVKKGSYLVRCMSAALEAGRKPRILDFGCSVASVPHYLTKTFGPDFKYDYVGIDGNVHFINVSRADFPNLRFIQAFCDDLLDGTVRPDGLFDVSILSGVVMFLNGKRVRRLIDLLVKCSRALILSDYFVLNSASPDADHAFYYSEGFPIFVHNFPKIIAELNLTLEAFEENFADGKPGLDGYGIALLSRNRPDR